FGAPAKILNLTAAVEDMRVLYVCTGNSFRSPVAEALTRKYRPGLEVESAGTHPADSIADNGKRMLEREGARQYVKPSPDSLSQRAVDEADRIVAMMPRHRDYLRRNFDTGGTEVEVWNVPDPVDSDVSPEDAFEQLRDRVTSS
ncbi:MAG: low molecular weight phosphatase family protein, partial [Candidatus Nanohaloarchaea archaeon]|nr:low molecular weight phosphatase family protein [Candidatus Nanohaloarchaea archaeon]